MVVIDDVNAFHDELHHLAAGDHRAEPSDQYPLPSLRAALDQKFGNELATARRQVFGEIGDEVEHVGLTAPAAGGNGNREQQCWEKREKKIERDSL